MSPGRGAESGLFDPASTGPPRIVRVLPDQTGLAKAFDYVVPEAWTHTVQVGDRVRIALGPRRVGAWVIAVDVEPATDVALRPLAKWSGRGPGPDLVELADWARWRWAARTAVPFLRTASPPRNVVRLPEPASAATRSASDDPALAEAFTGGVRVLRLPPTEAVLPVVVAAAGIGPALVICPARSQADRLHVRLRNAGIAVARYPEDWAAAAAGGRTVIGTRAAAWAPVPDLAAVVVLDEHDEVHQEEGSPTWHARDLAVERARRAGVPCVLVSAAPSPEARALGPVVTVDRARERAGWPALVVVDRGEDDVGRNGLVSPALASILRTDARIGCVLNRKGRATLLVCDRCRSVARCEDCRASLTRPGEALSCPRCGAARPEVCSECGGLRLRAARLGVSRIADDLAALTGEPVALVTADTDPAELARTRVAVGTEALLHRLGRLDVVAFLDFDAELEAPRYRAREEAMALLVRAARHVGGRRGSGRVVVQTLHPEDPVLVAALAGDPTRLADHDDTERATLGLPPAVAVAAVGGPAAEAFIAGLPTDAGLRVAGSGGEWRIVAPDHRMLCDALAATPRPTGRLRLAVDPLRL